MTADNQTIAVYNLKADEYEKAYSAAEQDPALLRFLSKIQKNAHILDLGCGPGTHAAAMNAHGMRVTATDASSSMVERARSHQGVEVYQAEFSDLRDEAVYDGVWANFSLLHAPRVDLPHHLDAIAAALKSGGVFHLAMKTGSGVERDHLGRCYTFYTVAELRELMEAAGFEIVGETQGESAGLAGTVDPWVEFLSHLKP